MPKPGEYDDRLGAIWVPGIGWQGGSAAGRGGYGFIQPAQAYTGPALRPGKYAASAAMSGPQVRALARQAIQDLSTGDLSAMDPVDLISATNLLSQFSQPTLGGGRRGRDEDIGDQPSGANPDYLPEAAALYGKLQAMQPQLLRERFAAESDIKRDAIGRLETDPNYGQPNPNLGAGGRPLSPAARATPAAQPSPAGVAAPATRATPPATDPNARLPGTVAPSPYGNLAYATIDEGIKARAIAQSALQSMGVFDYVPTDNEVGTFIQSGADAEAIVKYYSSLPTMVARQPGLPYGIGRQQYYDQRRQTEGAYASTFDTPTERADLPLIAAKSVDPSVGGNVAEPDWLKEVFREGMSPQEAQLRFQDYFKRIGKPPGAADVAAFRTRLTTPTSEDRAGPAGRLTPVGPVSGVGGPPQSYVGSRRR